MPAPTTAAILEAWEHSLAAAAPARPVRFLQRMLPAEEDSGVLDFSVGEFDGRLLAVREQLFGSQLTAVALCPLCQETAELEFSVGDLRPVESEPKAPTLEREISMGNYRVGFRLPIVRDLIDAATAVDARALFLQRCVVIARENGKEISAVDLPEPVIEALATAISAADPQAGPTLAVACPHCGHAWSLPFDPGHFLWSELQSWAQGILRDIHTLAAAYGWSEAEILALSPSRRRTYVEMSQA